MTVRRVAIAAALLASGGALATTAQAASLYTGPGPRPGPSLLYSKAKASPQLANAGIWKAQPILVSGSTAYRRGEFLYQDYLYDDNGAHLTADPNDPRTAGNLFSKQNGTLTYPTDKAYANNAADFVELRVKPLATATAFRVTLNTLKDPSRLAFSIGIGRRGGKSHAFPFGANVRAPADLFLTVHPNGAKLVAELNRASTGKRVKGKAPKVSLSRKRRQIEVRISHGQWNPKRRSVRLWAGAGLWDAAAKRYVLPQAGADASHPGGAGTATSPAAFFNVAFRTREPRQKPTEKTEAITGAAWWRDRMQGSALAANDISALHADVSFAKLARRATDNRTVQRTGAMDRILSTHFELAQGADFSQSCLASSANCPGQYQGRLQPYAIYIPKAARPARGYGMTLLLHSLSANYNQYLATRNMSQFGERSTPSIVITPEARGPDEGYENYGAADVFDVWADVARRYKLDPDVTEITGYSLGGIGTFKLGSQFPDLFARAQPTVGSESNNAVLASLRNVPVLMWNNVGDELVNDAEYNATAQALDSLGYRYELHAHQPCAHPDCSALFPNHLQLAINDQYAPAAAFLGSARVERNPAHVTYVLDSARNHGNLGVVGDHAYWLSGLKVRDPSANGAGNDPGGQIDAFSHGFGTSDPVPTPTQVGAGQLTGGNLGAINFSSRAKTWAPPTPAPKANTIDVTATNISKASIAVKRAGVDCSVKLNITSDGPIDIALPGCGKSVHADASSGSGLPGVP